MLVLMLFHVHAVLNLHLLLLLAVTLLLLLFPRCLSVSPVHIPYSPSSCYTIKKQFDIHPAVFLQVHLMLLLSRVLIQRCIILLTDFSSSQSCLLQVFLGNFFKISGHFQRDFVSASKKTRLSDTFAKHISHRQGSNFMDSIQARLVANQCFLITYSSLIFCMRRMSHTAIEDKPQIYHYETLVQY